MNRHGWPATRPVPLAETAPVSEVPSVASRPVASMRPIVRLPFSMIAENEASPRGRQREKALAGSGQGSRSIGSRRTSSVGSIRPASSGQKAMRSRTAPMVRDSPSSPTPTCLALSTGWGRSDSWIGPLIITGRPSVAEASCSTDSRYDSSPSSKAAPRPPRRPKARARRRPREVSGRPSLDMTIRRLNMSSRRLEHDRRRRGTE